MINKGFTSYSYLVENRLEIIDFTGKRVEKVISFKEFDGGVFVNIYATNSDGDYYLGRDKGEEIMPLSFFAKIDGGSIKKKAGKS